MASGLAPATAWLTPERQPFYGGTYFPPRDGERGVRTGFLTLLKTLKDAFDALNAMPIQAGNNIIVSITCDIDEGATPAVLNQPSISSWTSLTIKPTAGARTIAAGSLFGSR